MADWLLPAGSFSVEAGDYYGNGQLPGSADGVFLSDHSFAFGSMIVFVTSFRARALAQDSDYHVWLLERTVEIDAGAAMW